MPYLCWQHVKACRKFHEYQNHSHFLISKNSIIEIINFLVGVYSPLVLLEFPTTRSWCRAQRRWCRHRSRGSVGGHGTCCMHESPRGNYFWPVSDNIWPREARIPCHYSRQKSKSTTLFECSQNPSIFVDSSGVVVLLLFTFAMLFLFYFLSYSQIRITWWLET